MNHYSEHIENLLSRLLELRHTSSHIKSVLNSTIKNFESLENIDIISSSALAITDWTGPTNRGNDIYSHTGVRKVTYRDNYKQTVENIISIECCYAFAQSYEALEKFVKDCVFTKIKTDIDYRKKIGIINTSSYQRQEIPSGDKLFKWIKKASNPLFNTYSRKNNKGLHFKELWTVLSETRHAITHSNSLIKLEKVNKTEYHFSIFKSLFDFTEIDSKTLKIELDYIGLSDVINRISEFGFQIFKMLSEKENLNWNILKQNALPIIL